MSRKQRLELTWIGKDDHPRPEPRILIEDTTKSYGSRANDNRLILGDNLLALKALEAEFAGSVKCVYIDPPYNTGSAFEQYNDGLEHSLWLTLVRDRAEALLPLLARDGTLWVSIDDSEGHYLKVLLDELFGRQNFVGNVIWQKKYSPANDALWLSDSHDHVLVYARDKSAWSPNLLPRSDKSRAAYKNHDNDPRGPWKSGDYTCNKSADERPNLFYAVVNPTTGAEVWPKRTAVWRFEPEAHQRNVAENRVWWGKDGTNSVPAYKRFLTEVDDGVVPQTVWLWSEVGHTQDGKNEQKALNPDNPFATPKPERLIARILDLATRPGDLVLDSFAGSGTTGAVAHKMGRRWIMIEQGEHANTHIVPRLRKVIDAADPGGVTELAGWNGGGGFRFFNLAPSMVERDEWGNEVISPKYNAPMLAEAMCKHMGFAYAPDPDHFWLHGRSTERDFIYVTTAALTHEQLKKISDLVGAERTLLVCCRAFQKEHVRRLENLTVRKIPQAVLSKCEWGKDDYSMGLAEAPPAEDQSDESNAAPTNGAGADAPKPRKRKKPKPKGPQPPSLFDEGGKA